MDESTKLLKELMNTLSTIHLDMGGKHRYALSNKSHEVINKIRIYLYEKEKKA